MKKLLKLLILMLAVCGVSCERHGNLFGGGNNSGSNGGENGGNGAVSQNTFIINVSNITSDSASVSVSPSNSDTYYFDVIEKSTFDSYATSTQFATEYVAFLKDLCEEIGYNFGDILSSGSDSYSFGELETNTNYYIFAFGVTASGEVTTNVSVKAFKTLESSGNQGGGNTSANTFTITVSDITSKGAYIEVAPSNNDTYYFDVVEKSVFDNFSSPIDYATQLTAYLKEYYESSGYSLADALSSGRDGYEYQDGLDANTVYYAFAFGVSSDGVVTTDVAVEAFQTLASSGGNSGGTSGGDMNLNAFTYGYYSNYGDYYNSGATNWYIDLYTDDTYDILVLEVQTPLTATDFVGNYKFASTFAANTAVNGFIDDEGYICGSFWGLFDSDYNLADYRFCNSGSVNITKSGANYTIAVDALDADGNKIVSNYTGALEEYVEESSVMSRSVVKNPARRFRAVAKAAKQGVATPKLTIKKAIGVKQPLKITMSKRFN